MDKIGIISEIKTADIVIPILPIAPASSPHSNDLCTPRACAHVPIVKPFANLLLMLSFSKKPGPKMREKSAEAKTNNTVKEGIPPSDFETDKATGNVTDFGMRDATTSVFNPKTFANNETNNTPSMLPNMILANILRRYFFKRVHCEYSETAIDTTAVP